MILLLASVLCFACRVPHIHICHLLCCESQSKKMGECIYVRMPCDLHSGVIPVQSVVFWNFCLFRSKHYCLFTALPGFTLSIHKKIWFKSVSVFYVVSEYSRSVLFKAVLICPLDEKRFYFCQGLKRNIPVWKSAFSIFSLFLSNSCRAVMYHFPLLQLRF